MKEEQAVVFRVVLLRFLLSCSPPQQATQQQATASPEAPQLRRAAGGVLRSDQRCGGERRGAHENEPAPQRRWDATVGERAAHGLW